MSSLACCWSVVFCELLDKYLIMSVVSLGWVVSFHVLHNHNVPLFQQQLIGKTLRFIINEQRTLDVGKTWDQIVQLAE